MTLNIYKILKYQLYLLQLENYELGRYWKLLFARGWFPGKSQRKDIVWTAKALLVFVLSVALCAGLVFFVWGKLYFELGIRNLELWVLLLTTGYILSTFLFPIFYTLALVILFPVDYAF